MTVQNRSTWIKGSLIVAVVGVIVAAFVYLGVSRAADSPEAPKGSVYYKGRMAADIESEAHDPRKKAANQAPPTARK